MKKKTMTIKGFKRALKKLVGKKYHTVRREITEFRDEEVEDKWRAYGEGFWTHEHDTPEKALAEIDKHLKGETK